MAKKSEAKSNKIFLGIALLFLGLLLVVPSRQTTTVDSFASEPVRITGLSQEKIDDNKIPRRVLIPDIKIDLKVGKARNIEGYWEVFPDKAGWGEGSGLPGNKGNQVIFAHARQGLFLPLRESKVDMRIYVLSSEGWYLYQIEAIKEVYPNQTEVIEATQDETLTLYTCSGYKDTKRLIVIAKRIN